MSNYIDVIRHVERDDRIQIPTWADVELLQQKLEQLNSHNLEIHINNINYSGQYEISIKKEDSKSAYSYSLVPMDMDTPETLVGAIIVLVLGFNEVSYEVYKSLS